MTLPANPSSLDAENGPADVASTTAKLANLTIKQTDPFSLPLSSFYPTGIYPRGEEQPYVGLHASRLTDPLMASREAVTYEQQLEGTSTRYISCTLAVAAQN